MRILVLLAILCVGAVISSATAQEQVPRSSIAVLVDLSGTWFNAKSEHQNTVVLQAVAKGIAAAGLDLPQPLGIRYLPIGDLSLLREPMCTAFFQPQLIAPKHPGKGNYFYTSSSLAQFLGQDCARFVLTRPPAKFTDISGALDTAARLADGQIDGQKIILVLSDMKEELRKSQEPAELHLAGFTVILIYRILDEDRVTPKKLDDRINRWKSRLMAAGAVAHSTSDLALTAPQVKRLLTE